MTAPREDRSDWRSPVGRDNAIALRANYIDGFHAISEIDRIGHLILYRAGSEGPVTDIQSVVGIGLLRRAVTVFTGMRSLFEASSVDPAKALARAMFELFLNHQVLAYGSQHPVPLDTPTLSADREPRARKYYVAAERRGLRARALVLRPEARFPLRDAEAVEAVRKEFDNEIERLRREYPLEWKYFGDVNGETIIRHVGGRDEPPWFAGEFPSGRVRSIGQLAGALDHQWDYDFLYDLWSGIVHPRGIRQDLTIEGKHLDVHHPHDPSWFEVLAYFATSWQFVILMTAAKWHSPVMIPQLQELHRRLQPLQDTLRPRDFPSLLT